MISPIDVRDLIGRAGSSREVSIRGTIEDLGGELARVREPIEADLLLESVIEGILVEARIAAHVSLSCARCLIDFDTEFSVQASELFASEGSDDSDYVIEPGGTIDTDQLIRDALGVELPFSPLCRPDCLGLCPRCGGDLNTRGCTCGWSELPESSRRSYAGS